MEARPVISVTQPLCPRVPLRVALLFWPKFNFVEFWPKGFPALKQERAAEGGLENLRKAYKDL